MTYQLKGGEKVVKGTLYGWTGQKCQWCKGTGFRDLRPVCRNCGGTGDEYDVMPVQPADLPGDTE